MIATTAAGLRQLKRGDNTRWQSFTYRWRRRLFWWWIGKRGRADAEAGRVIRCMICDAMKAFVVSHGNTEPRFVYLPPGVERLLLAHLRADQTINRPTRTSFRAKAQLLGMRVFFNASDFELRA